MANTDPFIPLAIAGPNEVFWGRRRLIHFSGCDYFRLTLDPRLARGAQKELKRTGLNVAASRLTTGDRQIYHELETALARYFRCEAAVVLSDGYRAPLALAQAFAGEFTHVFIDELSHGASQDAVKMLGCPVKSFAHRNPAVLKKLLEGAGRKCRPVVFTDGMFSADGAVAPVREYLQFLPRSGRIFVDDAHGVGLLGAHGRGTLELADVDYERVVQCGTLSKAFGAFGGIILATETVRRQIIARSRSYAGATPLPPPLAGAALASLKILQMARARRQRLAANVTWFRSAVAAAGWEIPATTRTTVGSSTEPAAATRTPMIGRCVRRVTTPATR